MVKNVGALCAVDRITIFFLELAFDVLSLVSKIHWYV
jgi:hypothetical protein